jgi:hypothetical protein
MSALFVPVALTVVIDGDAGNVGARNGADTIEDADAPTALCAMSVNVYVAPGVSPEIFTSPLEFGLKVEFALSVFPSAPVGVAASE